MGVPISRKFPFAAITDRELIFESFNSNFNCACQLYLPSDIKENESKCVFSYNENDNAKSFDTNILNNNDNELEKLSVEPKFKHYQNHEFHKSK